MTSKHLFFKAMREDMRNRGWMIALSVLWSFLALPVTWLIGVNNMRLSSFGFYDEDVSLAAYIFGFVSNFWRNAANYLGGIVLIGGALIAALAGFRFVFYKNQVDTWHSLPIKRDMLFWVCYVNGGIVWLLPLFISTVLTAILSGGRVLSAGGGDMKLFYGVLRLAAGNFAVWTVIFLLVYHLVLLAMMLCGNVLNTMVSMLVMGFGCASLYALGIGLCEQYFNNFLFFGSRNALGAMYASPFVSAVTQLLERGEEIEGYDVGINLLIAAALAVCAWLLYRKRPSELAEQGIQSRVFSTALRLVTAFGAGVGGWLFFSALTDGNIMWCIFGVLLAAVLVHGILDVVFRMDFRAFFAHRLQMAGTVTAALLVCFAFCGDWFGYDSYLPAKEQIAEIGVRVESLSNRSGHEWMDVYSLEAMKYEDIETAYAFLQKMTGKINYRSTKIESVEVRVTLKNGRTYFRRYHMGEAEREQLMPIVSSEEYLKYAYCLNESVAENHKMTLQPVRGRQYFAEKKFAEGELLELLRAYNQDVLENPKAVLLGEDRILTEMNLSFVRTDGYSVGANLDIYESMERTIEALKSLGYEELVTPSKAAQIVSVDLSVDNFGVYRTAEDIVKAARERYQVYGGENAVEDGQTGEQAVAVETAESYSSQGIVSSRPKDLTLYITDPKEIEELLPLISYSDGNKRWGVFKKSVISISMTDKDGETIECYIRAGDLPEKYVLRFGELIEDVVE